MDELLERVYQAFDPAIPAVEDDIYVDLDEVRGHSDVVANLGQRIRLDTNTCYLLAGHHGSGKSTELKRLEKELSKGDKKYFVVFVEGKADLDLHDVDFPEILIALVRKVATELKKREGITLKPGYFGELGSRFKDFLGSDVDINALGLEVGLLKLSAAIKSSPSARDTVRAALEPDTSNLLDAANDLISQAFLKLQQKGYTNLVVIMDDLDKIVLRPKEGTGCSTAEYLFVNRHAQLTGFRCHTVYTVPLAIVYSSVGARIANLYGAVTPVLAMTKIRNKPSGKKEPLPGIECFRKIVAQRLTHARAKESKVFASNMVDRLIQLSGGQPRELMILIREALVGGGLPVQAKGVDLAERKGTHDYARQLTEEHWKLIKQVATSGKCGRTAENDATFRELLDSRAILQYTNDEEWFGVNPLIPLPAKKSAKKTTKK